jgi:hypothetical protein
MPEGCGWVGGWGTAVEARAYGDALTLHASLGSGNYEGVASWLQGVRHVIDLAQKLPA